MDKKEFNERSARLQEVGDVIERLPPEVRGDAFALLKEYVLPRSAGPSKGPDDQSVPDNAGDTNLFTQFDHEKPSDNVRLISAYFFREYGSESFSVDEIKALAAETGLTVPERVDMTLANATEKGKKLFVSVGRGKFKPTVHGEAFLKSTYGVKKGTKTRPAGGGEGP